MTPWPVPLAVRLLVRLTVPARGRAQAIADLEDDYTRERAGRGRLGAYTWLLRESFSLAAAYSVARTARLARSGPVLIRDLVLVLRGLRRGPIPALGAAAMLSTGLLAMLLTAGLSEALLFRPISRIHGDRLRRIGEIDRQGRATTRVSYPELEAVRGQLQDRARITAVSLQPIVVRDGNRSLQTMVEIVDGSYFGVVGTPTVIGRPLLAADDRLDAVPVSVISQPLWTTRFEGSAAVLGRSIDINGAPFTIVGVAAATGSSSFVGASVDAWITPAHADSVLNRGWRTNVDDRAFAAFAVAGGNAGELDAQLATAQADLARLYPERWRDRMIATSPATILAGSQRTTVSMLAAILLALSLLILATAAANLTGVFVARAAALRRQFAIHLAIGAGRAAIVRRQVIEGALLGLIGAAFAAGLYAWARVWLAEIALLPTLTLRLDLPVDVGVLMLVASAGAIAGGTLALGPALWAARVDVAAAMREAGLRVIAGRALSRIRQVLVSAQVAFSLVLMVGAVLFVRSLGALGTADIGFPRDRLVAMDFDVEPSGTPAADLPALARETLRRVRDLPEVAAAALSNRAPVDQSTPSVDVHVDNGDGAAIGNVTFYLATESYFDTVGIPIVQGRGFTPDEVERAADVAVINETLAQRAWPGGEAIGHALYLEQDGRTLRVVGVARNSRYRTIDESPRPHVYRPVAPRLGLTLLARTSADPRQTLVRMQRALDAVGPGVTGFFPRTLDDHLAIELLPARAAASAASILGVLALIFSGVGLYGLVSWFVVMRRGELGIRMALGASGRDVARLVIRQAAAAAAPGVAAGVILAIAFATLAQKALFGVVPVDPAALAIALFAIVLIVAVSAYAPARRAARIDPADTLRA